MTMINMTEWQHCSYDNFCHFRKWKLHFKIAYSNLLLNSLNQDRIFIQSIVYKNNTLFQFNLDKWHQRNNHSGF